MKNKLTVIGKIKVYSHQDTWHIYRDIIQPLKNKILSGEINTKSVRYGNDFDEKYNPATNEKNWGTNLDNFDIEVDKNLNAKLSYFYVTRWAAYEDLMSNFKFEIKFKLPENMLDLFAGHIENAFYRECVALRELELHLAEEKRIKEIGQELLNKLK